MGIFSFLRRKKTDYGDYKQSSHVEEYEQIAARLDTAAQHVYEIAHGKAVRCYDDRVILCALKQARIVGD